MSPTATQFAAAIEKATTDALASGVSNEELYFVLGGMIGYSLANDQRNTPKAIEAGLSAFFAIAHEAATDVYAQRFRTPA